MQFQYQIASPIPRWTSLPISKGKKVEKSTVKGERGKRPIQPTSGERHFSRLLTTLPDVAGLYLVPPPTHLTQPAALFFLLPSSITYNTVRSWKSGTLCYVCYVRSTVPLPLPLLLPFHFDSHYTPPHSTTPALTAYIHLIKVGRNNTTNITTLASSIQHSTCNLQHPPNPSAQFITLWNDHHHHHRRHRHRHRRVHAP